jgi:quercetin dioxygenase-like cupin family protein
MAAGQDFPDAIAAASDIYRVVAEDDHVRVLEARMAPGAASPMHYHPHGVIITYGAATLQLAFPNGSGAEAAFGEHQAFIQPAGAHRAENVGTTDVHVVVVEVKE